MYILESRTWYAKVESMGRLNTSALFVLFSSVLVFEPTDVTHWSLVVCLLSFEFLSLRRLLGRVLTQ